MLFQDENAAASPRASVTFAPDGGAVIRIFKGADLSSIPHEAAHVFVDGLRRVAESDGGIARERLADGLKKAALTDRDLRDLADAAMAGLREEREAHGNNLRAPRKPRNAGEENAATESDGSVAAARRMAARGAWRSALARPCWAPCRIP